MPLAPRDLEKIAAFAFGVIFLIGILVLVVLIPSPTPAQFFAFRLTMALSAAGVGALLPGFLRLDIPLPLKGAVRAGGALALFASVWFVNPASLEPLGIEVQPAPGDARVLIEQFLRLTDAGDHKAAYALFARRNKERVREDAYVLMGAQVRDPLGGPTKRVLVSADTPNMINGVRGAFVVNGYQSRFQLSKDVWAEIVSTIPEDGVWRISSYNIGRCEAPFCVPLPALSP